jgi:hypothetical protein
MNFIPGLFLSVIAVGTVEAADVSINLKDMIVPVLVAFLTGIAGPVILTYIKHKLYVRTKEIKKKNDDFVTSIETQELINKSLNQLQEKFKLDRIWIAQFHNGGHFYPGNKSMKKMSVTFESTAPGVAADIMKMQSLPVSFFSSILQKLNNGEESVTVDVYKEDDHALRSFWTSKGTNAVYVYPIHCLEGGFIGILGVDLVKTDELLPEDVHKHLRNEAILLSGYVAALSIDKS